MRLRPGIDEGVEEEDRASALRSAWKRRTRHLALRTGL